MTAGSFSTWHQLSPHSTTAVQLLGSQTVLSWFPVSNHFGVTPAPAQSFAHLLDHFHDVPVVPELLRVPLDQGSAIHCASLPS